MPRSDGTLELRFGFCADDISKQVLEQGYYLPADKERYFNKCKNAVNQLKFVITDSMYSQICKRINNEIRKEIEKYLMD